MENADNFLEEFETIKTRRSNKDVLIERLDLIFIIYLILLLILKFLYFEEEFYFNTIYSLIFITAVPLFFWFLFIKRYKTGWFLRVSYYSIVFIVIGVNLLSKDYNEWTRVHFCIILLISMAIVSTSFLREILDKSKIGAMLITTYVILAILLALAYVYSVLFVNEI